MKRTDKRKVLLYSAIIAVGFMFMPWAAQLTHATGGGNNDDMQQEQDQYQDQGQDQSQGQDQGQEQGQEQSMGDMTGGTQTMSFKGQKQAFSANAPNVFSTAPCYVGMSAGIGLQGLNIGGGKSKLDEQCELRETARMLIAAGEIELGVKMLCLTNAASLLGEGTCHPHNDVKAALKEAKANIKHLLTERDIDRQKCNESKSRITDGCYK